MNTSSKRPHTLDLKSRIAQACYPVFQTISGQPSARKYNLSISHQYRFIWFRVAKNGTRTLLRTLKNHDVPLDVEHVFATRYPIRRFSAYYKFAVVRNPWDRLVSCWFAKILRKNAFNLESEHHEELKNFPAFVDFVASRDIENCDAHYASQSSLIDLNELDYLGRMETFEEDILHVFSRIGVVSRGISVTNVSETRGHYAEYYTDSLQKQVGKIYRKDIQIFGYSF